MKRLRIGPARYRVRVMEMVDSEDKLGLARSRHSEIRLAATQSATSRRDTLLHEVLHAVCYESGLCHVLGIEDADEERLIRILTPWLLGVLRDNPQLVAYLIAK